MHYKRKPFRGWIENWRKVEYADGYIYAGLFVGHPIFNGRVGHTSKVILDVGGYFETLNSRYGLGEKAK